MPFQDQDYSNRNPLFPTMASVDFPNANFPSELEAFETYTDMPKDWNVPMSENFRSICLFLLCLIDAIAIFIACLIILHLILTLKFPTEEVFIGEKEYTPAAEYLFTSRFDA